MSLRRIFTGLLYAGKPLDWISSTGNNDSTVFLNYINRPVNNAAVCLPVGFYFPPENMIMMQNSFHLGTSTAHVAACRYDLTRSLFLSKLLNMRMYAFVFIIFNVVFPTSLFVLLTTAYSLYIYMYIYFFYRCIKI